MNRLIKFIGIGLILIGLSLFVISLTFDRYTNESEFQDKVLAIDEISDNNSEQYNKLREEYLTPKIVLENYSFTSIVLGSIILVISLIGITKIKTPKTNLGIVFLGLSATVLTSVGDAGDLFLESYRGSSTFWEDSLVIPLISVPFFFIVWVFVNSIGMKGQFQTNVKIFPMKFKHLNIWYSIFAIITILIEIFLIIFGGFWFILPGFLWLYFYISLLLGIRESKLKEGDIIGGKEIEKVD